jgi:hypothetical protein
MLFNRLFDLDLLDLRPCHSVAICVYLLINWGNYTKFWAKVNEKFDYLGGFWGMN